MCSNRFRPPVLAACAIMVPAILFCTVLGSLAADVTLAWDANDPTPEGYRVFARENSASYNYTTPIKQTAGTGCTLIGLTEGITYCFVVRAYDGDLESADSEEVCYTPSSVPSNQAPVAEAGGSQNVYEEAGVTLDGSTSSDADGSISAYLWEQTGGTVVALNDVAMAQASFTAPVVDLGGETLTFRLTVTDDQGDSSTDTATVNVLKSSSTDRDGDNVPDVNDLFPDDPAEWADNDNDGTGDNADTDDDNDGMSDTWEETYGLDPLTDDAILDADGDGVSNIEEFAAGSDPSAAQGNTAPEAPTIEEVSAADTASLTPVLVTAAYFDADSDDHTGSQWQIGIDGDFSTLILDQTSEKQLTAYQIGNMVLESDATYYWRVRFIDARSGVSEWSETGSFITVASDASGDENFNGIPDDQEVEDTSADINQNGIADSLDTELMSLNTVEGRTKVALEPVSNGSALVSARSISTDSIADRSVQPNFGLIGFRLYLDDGVGTSTVKISFDRQVPSSARLYKYFPDSGWQTYTNALLAADGKSVTLTLVDGGRGDEDGVANGVIVDPIGVVYTEPTDSAAAATSGYSGGGGGGGGGGCFIAAMQ
ncbi:choice-of-anchor U domain-containing protein [uncultured Desulfosarcina sp.]|uniref:fibronectin type III domain-containing protein n=1 Tax=uncultured Desulfosarcina sp. TaxID=218289 RepID=UPI0029C78E81|nr:choice-of-anchor U domain-containing protein [uncultured Desulfosarcina sp.]